MRGDFSDGEPREKESAFSVPPGLLIGRKQPRTDQPSSPMRFAVWHHLRCGRWINACGILSLAISYWREFACLQHSSRDRTPRLQKEDRRWLYLIDLCISCRHSIVWCCLGPLAVQHLDALRRQNPKVHRISGRIALAYTPCSSSMAFSSTSATPHENFRHLQWGCLQMLAAGSNLLAAFEVVTIWQAYRAPRDKQYALHRDWAYPQHCDRSDHRHAARLRSRHDFSIVVSLGPANVRFLSFTDPKTLPDIVVD